MLGSLAKIDPPCTIFGRWWIVSQLTYAEEHRQAAGKPSGFAASLRGRLYIRTGRGYE